MAEQEKSSTGWLFGFKLHMIINYFGEITRLRLTPGNVHDSKPLLDLIKGSFSRLYADKGYWLRSLKQKMKTMGIDLITNVRRHRKLVKHSGFDKSILRRRSIIETVFDELKNLCQIEHTRHRSPVNFVVNLLAGLVAYCLMPSKPKLPVIGTYIQA